MPGDLLTVLLLCELADAAFELCDEFLRKGENEIGKEGTDSP
jgi:hypothetical protein